MLLKILLIISIAILNTKSEDLECISREYDYGTVCVCNTEYCDTISQPEKLEPPNFIKYTSNEKGLRFKKEVGTFQNNYNNAVNTIYIDRNKEYQKIIGWGGAFTDSTAINIQSLDKNVQNHLIRSYFSEQGLEYSLGRVPIAGTDFSTHGYTYDDGDVDKNLTNFKLAPEDFDLKIPLIKEALNLTNGKLNLFASAWVAPKWMKTKQDGVGAILDDMYQTWADYFLKFLQEYKKEGIDFWGITTGNEAISTLIFQIDSVRWWPWQMADWIENHLGPTLRQSKFSDIKILALDDQRIYLPWILDVFFENNKTRNYVDGVAVHWYMDQFIPASLLTATHEKFPEKFILATEACAGYVPFLTHLKLGAWYRAESYADNIIEDVNNFVTGWVDWNMALDENGGPTYINNFVDSPIIVNATANEFYKQPMYYAMGHFSKFVPPNSKRIGLSSNVTNVPVVAFQRPDNATVLVILNKREDEVNVTISDDLRGEMFLTVTEKSITTLLYW